MIKKTLLYLIKNNLILYISSCLANILEILLSVVMPLVSGYLISSLLNADKKSIIKYLSLHIMINIALLCMHYIRGLILNNLSTSVSYFFRMEFYKKLVNSNFIIYNNTESGKILSIFSNDIQSSSSFFCDKIISIFNTIISLIAMFSITLYMNLYIGIVLIIFSPSFYFSYILFKKHLKKQYILTKETYDGMLTVLQETIHGFSDVCLLNISSIMIKRFSNRVNNYVDKKK